MDSAQDHTGDNNLSKVNDKDSNPEANQTIATIDSPYLTEAFAAGVKQAVGFINTVLQEAVRFGASDILFEPEKDIVKVRARIDGVLHVFGQFSKDYYEQIVSRIKILSRLNTTEKRRIQEGQFALEVNSQTINFRVEIVQTIRGEMVVIRILQVSRVIMQLEQLGFNKSSLSDYMKILSTKSGLILVCGPTGSGKTTTLYSTISTLNADKKQNIITIEDPVEYQLAGINQMQVNVEHDFTFGAGLRSALRLTPDIVLVGEIRDRQTAYIAVESGLTGHMVLSTIHSGDAVGVIYRLLDLDIETYLLNSSLRGIIAQRLVRRVCEHCRQMRSPTEDERKMFQDILGQVPEQIPQAMGCINCQNLGYKGRIGIYEVLTVDAQVRTLIRDQSSEDKLRQTLKTNNFITLLMDGLGKCSQGMTTTDEVLRNTFRVD